MPKFLKSEQLYDLIAETDWEMCPHDMGTLSAGCLKHYPDFKETNILRPHYDLPNGTVMVNVRGVCKVYGKYVYEKPAKRKKRGSAVSI